MEAFHGALTRLIVPGRSTVADIGTGSGVLAMLAARLGARKIYAYEMAEIGAVAERLVRHNKFRSIELIPGRSTDIIDPPRVDIVVSETLGNYALEENIIETMNDAVARHLAPGGTIIPARLEQFVAPVVAPRLRDELAAWDRVGLGLDLGPATAFSLNNAYVRTLVPDELLDRGKSAQVWDRIDLSKKNRLSRKGRASWLMEAQATIHGLAVWWCATLVDPIALSTGPFDPATHWEQLFFPALDPISLSRGETLAIELSSRSSDEGGTDLAWTLVRVNAKGREAERQALSLDQGFIP
ncbi:MAG TPA: 50S ribosomal protein L11 methyltransferase [Hyphomicrobiaceae bacterium]|nr:50S ribosomal protein L11 methyltransferase [Hyphomicrobiaceae bacterium]